MSEVKVEAGGRASIQILLIGDGRTSTSGVKMLRRGTEMPESVLCSGPTSRLSWFDGEDDNIKVEYSNLSPQS